MNHPLFKLCCPLLESPTPSLQWVEVATFFKIPSFTIVGLPGPEVNEARERVRAAIETSGLKFPQRKVVINLTPPDIKKFGTGADLPLALAILTSSQEGPPGGTAPRRICAWGTLSLGGEIRPVGYPIRSMLSILEGDLDAAILHPQDMEEIRAAYNRFERLHSKALPRLISASHLGEAFSALLNISWAEPTLSPIPEAPQGLHQNLSSMPLLPLPAWAERWVLAAALGRHHLLVLGPRGAGKTECLKWLSALAPRPSLSQEVQLSLMLENSQTPLQKQSPPWIRHIGPQIKASALLGSYSHAHFRPGELILAHEGCLIADEFLEWHRDSLEALRESLEQGTVTLNRVRGSVQIKTHYQFLGSGNLCRCGGVPPFLESVMPKSKTRNRCVCSSMEQKNYLRKLSGPLVDRIDMLIIVSSLPAHPMEPTSQGIMPPLLERLETSRKLAGQTLGNLPGRLSSVDLEDYLRAEPTVATLLKELNWCSLRSRHKILKVALSLTFLDQKVRPEAHHFWEASCFRPERWAYFTGDSDLLPEDCFSPRPA